MVKSTYPPYVSNSFSGGGVDGILETELTSGEPNLLLYKKTVFIFLFCWLTRSFVGDKSASDEAI